jgi:uncharacterized membrane protein
MRILGILLLISLISNVVSGITITGTIYDYELTPVQRALLEVNTTPTQQFVITNAQYKIDLPNGEYTFTATIPGTDLIAQENITIQANGTYNIDLIMFPSFSDENELIDAAEELEGYSTTEFAIIIVVSIILLTLLYLRKRPNKELAPDLQDVLNIITKERRINQKELRKILPYSEAKISIMLAELEQKNAIKRIKQGRGNIIILK